MVDHFGQRGRPHGAMHPAANQVIGLYERHALTWDLERRQGPLFERPWLDRFRAALIADLPVLDIGCGAGEPVARYLVDLGPCVTGVDSSPSLIDLCRQRFPTGHWIVADRRRIDLRVGFGGILAWDSFFHLPPEDQRTMFPIFRSHAASQAVRCSQAVPRTARLSATTGASRSITRASLPRNRGRCLASTVFTFFGMSSRIPVAAVVLSGSPNRDRRLQIELKLNRRKAFRR